MVSFQLFVHLPPLQSYCFGSLSPPSEPCFQPQQAPISVEEPIHNLLSNKQQSHATFRPDITLHPEGSDHKRSAKMNGLKTNPNVSWMQTKPNLEMVWDVCVHILFTLEHMCPEPHLNEPFLSWRPLTCSHLNIFLRFSVSIRWLICIHKIETSNISSLLRTFVQSGLNRATGRLFSDIHWILEILQGVRVDTNVQVRGFRVSAYSLSAWPPSIKSAETLEELMWEHSRRSSSGFTASKCGVDDVSNIQQAQKWKRKAQRETILDLKKRIHTWKTRRKMSREFIFIRADAGVSLNKNMWCRQLDQYVTSCLCLLHQPSPERSRAENLCWWAEERLAAKESDISVSCW